MEDSKMKFVFFGTPEFGAIVLEQLLEKGLKPSLVVTTKDKPVGRKQELTASPVKVLAKKSNIQVEELTGKIKNQLTADLFVVAAYGEILPKNILDIPKKGTLNVHPSLLPKYRGPSPVHSAILNGDKETGVSIILLDEKIDHGPILIKETYEGDISTMTTPQLTQKLAVLGGILLTQAMEDWVNDGIHPTPQDDSKASYTEIIKKEDGRIDWNKDAAYIERQIRAYADWPGAYTFVEHEGRKLRLKINKAIVRKKTKLDIGGPGTVMKGAMLVVQAGNNSTLLVEEFQLEGKKVMPYQDFIRGYPWIIGKRLN